MSTTGKTDVEMSVVGEAGSPDAVVTSKPNNEETPGAAPPGETKPGDVKEPEKPKLTGTRRKLPPPTSIVEENKKKKESSIYIQALETYCMDIKNFTNINFKKTNIKSNQF